VITTRKVETSERFPFQDERAAVADLRRQRLLVRAIAAEIGRSPSTISRELRRNRDPERGEYLPLVAQRLAVDCRACPGGGRIVNGDVFREFVSNCSSSVGARRRSALLVTALPKEPVMRQLGPAGSEMLASTTPNPDRRATGRALDDGVCTCIDRGPGAEH
jgi:Helix-turn-helix domain